jgi:Alpha galactosidase C-terminal beta sandwich domain
MPFSSPGPFWEAEVTGLQPNTLYHYSVGSSGDESFRTRTSDFTIDAEGDIGGSNSFVSVPGIERLIADDLPAFVLIVWDLTYGNQTGPSVDQHFNDVMVWSQGTFNRGWEAVSETVQFRDVGLGSSANVRDVWARKDLGSFQEKYTAVDSHHGVGMIQVKRGS